MSGMTGIQIGHQSKQAVRAKRMSTRQRGKCQASHQQQWYLARQAKGRKVS